MVWCKSMKRYGRPLANCIKLILNHWNCVWIFVLYCNFPLVPFTFITRRCNINKYPRVDHLTFCLDCIYCAAFLSEQESSKIIWYEDDLCPILAFRIKFYSLVRWEFFIRGWSLDSPLWESISVWVEVLAVRIFASYRRGWESALKSNGQTDLYKDLKKRQTWMSFLGSRLVSRSPAPGGQPSGWPNLQGEPDAPTNPWQPMPNLHGFPFLFGIWNNNEKICKWCVQDYLIFVWKIKFGRIFAAIFLVSELRPWRQFSSVECIFIVW